MVMKLQNLLIIINPHDLIVVSDADDEWCLMINDMLTSLPFRYSAMVENGQ